MSQPVHTILFCEDLQLRVFVRRLLLKRGWERRQIDEVPIPAGGAGVSWLREELPRQLAAFRSRNARAQTSLIIGCDADEKTVAERIAWLEGGCTAAGVRLRAPDERVALAIPRRNIETWLRYLRGEPVNETEAFPKYETESDCRGEVALLSEICGNQARWPGGAPPDSLLRACGEFQRLRE